MDNKVQTILYTLFKVLLDTFKLPTDSTIFRTLCYSFAIFTVSLFSKLFGFMTFISWPGALICVVILTAFLIKERRENDSLVRAYKRAEAVAKQAAARAKQTGTQAKQKLEQQRRK